MKNSFSYSGAFLWNSLPVELRQANSWDIQGWLKAILLKINLHGTYVKQAHSLIRFYQIVNVF